MNEENEELEAISKEQAKTLYNDLRGKLRTAVSTLNGAINAKQDAPETAGTAGQVLGLDNQLKPVWVNQQGGGQTDIGLSIVDGKLCVTYEEASA